ncbi:uncharacterized protein ColTof4_02497 [Colletotrichum tofieldiae]|nr:hypothetical protein ColTof3_09212 [Colletotrichum tofieldiae]GKT70074.1 uncharacterized protein ColTof4_02497 [Colletotrichum tofieldiae]GKT93108.1 hypothetical protein Ct61P_10958 [Colletotrichum tofieldiae]
MATLDELVAKTYSTLIDQPSHTLEQVATVKALLRLYLAAFVLKDYDETFRLLHPKYKQHDPLVGDGRQSIIDFFTVMNKKTSELIGGEPAPAPEIHFKRVLVDSPYVIVHVHAIRYPADLGIAIMDLFKYENGLFTEHWDVIQPVPVESGNSNTMF